MRVCASLLVPVAPSVPLLCTSVICKRRPSVKKYVCFCAFRCVGLFGVCKHVFLSISYSVCMCVGVCVCVAKGYCGCVFFCLCFMYAAV